MMRSALLLCFLLGAPAGAAPVPTHLYPREPDPVVPGLVFAWTADGERWVIRSIGFDGRAQCFRVGGKSHAHPFDVGEVRKAHHFGTLLTPPEDAR